MLFFFNGEKHEKASMTPVFLFFVAILLPFKHGILCFVLNMLRKWIYWTFVNRRSQILFEFDALLKHMDTLLVSWQNFVQASLFACLSLFVPC